MVVSFDGLDVVVTVLASVGVEIGVYDNLIIGTIDEAERVGLVVVQDFIELASVEETGLFVQTTGLDPPGIHLQENAALSIFAADDLEVQLEEDKEVVHSIADLLSGTLEEFAYISMQSNDGVEVGVEDSAAAGIHGTDNLNFSLAILIPFGFNGQKFNQPQQYKVFDLEESRIDIPQFDDLQGELQENVSLHVEISTSDDLNVIVDRTGTVDKHVSVSDSLVVELKEDYVSSAEITISDNLNFNFAYLDPVIELSSSIDSLPIIIDAAPPRITGTLSYLVNDKFQTIEKGYIKIRGEFKPIIQYYGLINGEWKPRKT